MVKPNDHKSILNNSSIALRITLIYAAVGGLWILTSDQILNYIAKDNQTLTNLQTFKGWIFIIITTLLLYLLIYRYISKLNRSEQQISGIARGVSATTGLVFFQSLVQHLAQALEMDYVLIGEIDNDNTGKVRTVAMSVFGKIAENMEYGLAGTPCENVFKGKLCTYEEGIRLLYPEDEMLGELDLESYIGTPLFDSNKNVIGLMIVMDQKPLKNKALAESMLQIFAVRAAAEMERMRSEKALAKSESKFRELFNNANDAFLLCQFDSGNLGRFIEVNDLACEIFNLPREILLTISPLDLANKDFLDKLPCIEKDLQRVGHATYEVEYITNDKVGLPLEIKSHVFNLDNQKVVLSVARDITERKEAEQRLNHLAFHDSLTDLPNRMLFNNRLNHALEQAKRRDQQVGVIFLDLDEFKIINDTLGHAVGDILLKGVAERISQCLRKGDTVARMGGDEFTVLLQGINSIEETANVASKILNCFSQPWVLNCQEVNITASVGITIFPVDGDNVDTLLKNADMAMYSAKEGGRNDYRFYSQDMNTTTLERVVLEQELRLALRNLDFTLHYQPKVNTDSGEIIGMEALIRWNHPEKGFLPPCHFIPLAESTGLIIPLGKWVLKEACRQNKAWQMAGLPPMQVAVNISARQFYQVDFVDSIAKVLEETGLAAQYLELEITESIAMQEVNLTLKILKELKHMGVHIAIDDFGTGYSALNYLKQFPINTLKIDRCFIQDLKFNNNDAAITNAIIAMGKSLKLDVIAEGVETEEQLSFLKNAQCNLMQGYFFGRPMPAEDFNEFILKYSNK